MLRNHLWVARQRGMYAQGVLWVIVVATALRVWFTPWPTDTQWPIEQTAQAQIPNSGAQRIEMIQEMQRTNNLLAEVLQVMKSGQLTVQITLPVKPAAGQVPPAGGR